MHRGGTIVSVAVKGNGPTAGEADYQQHLTSLGTLTNAMITIAISQVVYRKVVYLWLQKLQQLVLHCGIYRIQGRYSTSRYAPDSQLIVLELTKMSKQSMLLLPSLLTKAYTLNSTTITY
jgi:hypothetical protein